MFFHKKSETNWPMIIFGLVVLAVAVLAIGILVIMVGKIKNKDFGTSQKKGDVTLEISTPESVNNNYVSEIKKLIEKVEAADNFDLAWKEIKPTFFNLRVPEEKLDIHLDVFLKLQEMNKNGKDTKDEAIELLNKLVD